MRKYGLLKGERRVAHDKSIRSPSLLDFLPLYSPLYGGVYSEGLVIESNGSNSDPGGGRPSGSARIWPGLRFKLYHLRFELYHVRFKLHHLRFKLYHLRMKLDHISPQNLDNEA